MGNIPQQKNTILLYKHKTQKPRVSDFSTHEAWSRGGLSPRLETHKPTWRPPTKRPQRFLKNYKNAPYTNYIHDNALQPCLSARTGHWFDSPQSPTGQTCAGA